MRTAAVALPAARNGATTLAELPCPRLHANGRTLARLRLVEMRLIVLLRIARGVLHFVILPRDHC